MFNAPNIILRTSALLWLAAGSAMAGPIGYAINFGGQLGTIDLGTGIFTPVGPGTGNTPDGLGGAPGGPFYTVDGGSGHLLRIGANGAVTDVGNTGTGPNLGPNGVSVMGSLTTGALFALDFSNLLYSINPGTGALSLLGSLALPTQESEYSGNMTTSFNGNSTHLYYTLEISGGPNQTGPTLFRIDPATLAVTSVSLQAPSRVIGSGFVGGVFYAFTEGGEILQVNPNTGQTTVAANYDSGVPPGEPGPPLTGIFGVVDTPEPSTLALLGAGLLTLAAGRHRRRGSNAPRS